MIKGPQTAQFGRNTFSGPANIIPKLSGDVWEGDVGLDRSPSQNNEYKADIAFGESSAVFKDTTLSRAMVFKPTDKLNLKAFGYYTFCGKLPDGEHIATPVTLRPPASQSASGAARRVALTTLHPAAAQHGIVRNPGSELGGRTQFTTRFQANLLQCSGKMQQ